MTILDAGGRARTHRLLALAVATSLAAASGGDAVAAGTAASVVKAADAPCAALRGFLTDTDPRGTNVRSGPSGDAPVLTRIPAAMPMTAGDPHAETVTASVRVIGSHAGWLLVRDVGLGDGRTNRFAWSGPGWVSGGLVGFTIGSLVMHAGPSTTSPVRKKLTGPVYGPDSYRVVRTYACRGRWAEVAVTSPGPGGRVPLRGWVGAVCDTQLTTCDNFDLPAGADPGPP